jgi:hypothetical protein
MPDHPAIDLYSDRYDRLVERAVKAEMRVTKLEWELRAMRRGVDRLAELSEKAGEGPWYVAPARRDDGLAEIEDGKQHGIFPIVGEWHEIEFIVAAVNFVRDLLPLPTAPTTEGE